MLKKIVNKQKIQMLIGSGLLLAAAVAWGLTFVHTKKASADAAACTVKGSFCENWQAEEVFGAYFLRDVSPSVNGNYIYSLGTRDEAPPHNTYTMSVNNDEVDSAGGTYKATVKLKSQSGSVYASLGTPSGGGTPFVTKWSVQGTMN